MKVGSVTLDAGGLIPTVCIELWGNGATPKLVDALLDSGFTGAVSLPLADVEALQLKWSGERLVILADARGDREVYRGVVVRSERGSSVESG